MHTYGSNLRQQLITYPCASVPQGIVTHVYVFGFVLNPRRDANEVELRMSSKTLTQKRITHRLHRGPIKGNVTTMITLVNPSGLDAPRPCSMVVYYEV